MCPPGFARKPTQRCIVAVGKHQPVLPETGHDANVTHARKIVFQIQPAHDKAFSKRRAYLELVGAPLSVPGYAGNRYEGIPLLFLLYLHTCLEGDAHRQCYRIIGIEPSHGCIEVVKRQSCKHLFCDNCDPCSQVELGAGK